MIETPIQKVPIQEAPIQEADGHRPKVPIKNSLKHSVNMAFGSGAKKSKLQALIKRNVEVPEEKKKELVDELDKNVCCSNSTKSGSIGLSKKLEMR